jgi:hypothetical protein
VQQGTGPGGSPAASDCPRADHLAAAGSSRSSSPDPGEESWRARADDDGSPETGGWDMSEHAVPGPATAGAPAAPVPRERTRSGSLWLGWLYLGGMMMFLVGAFTAFQGLVALFDDEYYVTTPQGLLVFDITGWGWIHLTIGVVAIAVAIGVFVGATWARICGVILCGISALTQLLFLSAYPAWAVIVIVFDILVIWALIVHGDEARG